MLLERPMGEDCCVTVFLSASCLSARTPLKNCVNGTTQLHKASFGGIKWTFGGQDQLNVFQPQNTE